MSDTFDELISRLSGAEATYEDEQELNESTLETNTLVPMIKPKDLCVAVIDNTICLSIINFDRTRVKLLDSGEIINLEDYGKLFIDNLQSKDGAEYFYTAEDEDFKGARFMPIVINTNNYEKTDNCFAKNDSAYNGDIYLGKSVINSLGKELNLSETQKKLMTKIFESMCGVAYKMGFDYMPKNFVNDNRNYPHTIEKFLFAEDALNDIVNGERTTDQIIPVDENYERSRDF